MLLESREVKIVNVHRKLVEQWCHSENEPFFRIAYPSTLFFQEISPVVHAGSQNFLQVQRANVFCARITEALLFSDGAPVIAPGGVLLGDGLTHKDYLIEEFFSSLIVGREGDGYQLRLAPPVMTIEKECIYLGGSKNFGHFLYEYLSRLAVVNQCNQISHLPILVYDDIPARFLDFLNLAGYDHTRRITIPRSAPVKVGQLWMPSCPIHRDRQARMCLWPAAYHYLRNTFASGKLVANLPRRRLYFSRAAAANKRLVNEEDLIRELIPRGFEVVEPAEMSVDQQLSAVANAEIILCPLGAASSISVMAPDDCVVIEMLGDKSVLGAYNSILAARCLGQSYARIHGERVYLPDNTRQEGIYADFKVDVSVCAQLIDFIENGLPRASSRML
jgi:hypothetical protein